MVDKTRTQLETATGGTFDFDNPEVIHIRTQDIALALAKQCRYNGHCKLFYSVAEHSILMAIYALEARNDEGLALHCLMHDASEAYVGDVPSPLKAKLGDAWTKIEQNVIELIEFKYRLEFGGYPEVHELDRRICLDEKAVLYPNSRFRWIAEQNGLERLGIQLRCWNPLEAALMFLHIYNTLTGENVKFRDDTLPTI